LVSNVWREMKIKNTDLKFLKKFAKNFFSTKTKPDFSHSADSLASTSMISLPYAEFRHTYLPIFLLILYIHIFTYILVKVLNIIIFFSD